MCTINGYVIFCLQMLITVVFCIHKPEQIHLSFGDTHSSMVVMWSSRDNVGGMVQYGSSSGQLEFVTASFVQKLPTSDYKAAPFIHRAVLKNLTEGRTYFYKIVHVRQWRHHRVSRTESDVYSFNTTVNRQNGTLKYLVYGDMGADDSIPTYGVLDRYVSSGEYAAIWHVGDMAYDLHSDHGQIGDKFMNKIQPFASRVPYMTTPGNHEIADDCIHYRTRFAQPNTRWPIPVKQMWYSYNVGLVHFISYSTEVFFTGNEDYVCNQFYWLLQDLITANENREHRPWIVAIGHRPMYCSNGDADDCTNTFTHRWVKYGLEDLFHAQGVDLIIEAHEHSYERLWPVYDGRSPTRNYDNPRAPVHIISGAAGSLEGINWMSHATNEWTAFKADSSSKFTFGKLEVHNASHLYFEQIEAKNESVLDNFWLVQHNHGAFVANITCNGTGSDIHPSCTCPPPIRYVYYIMMAAGCLILIIMFIIVAIIVCKKKCRSKCHKKKANSLDGNVSRKYSTLEETDNRTNMDIMPVYLDLPMDFEYSFPSSNSYKDTDKLL